MLNGHYQSEHYLKTQSVQVEWWPIGLGLRGVLRTNFSIRPKIKHFQCGLDSMISYWSPNLCTHWVITKWSFLRMNQSQPGYVSQPTSYNHCNNSYYVLNYLSCIFTHSFIIITLTIQWHFSLISNHFSCNHKY